MENDHLKKEIEDLNNQLQSHNKALNLKPISYEKLSDVFVPDMGYSSKILLSNGESIYGFAYTNENGEIAGEIFPRILTTCSSISNMGVGVNTFKGE